MLVSNKKPYKFKCFFLLFLYITFNIILLDWMRRLSVIPSCTPIYIRFEKGFGQNTFIPWHTKHYRFTTKLCYFKFIYIWLFVFIYLQWILILYVTETYTYVYTEKMCGIFALNCNFKWVFSLNHNKTR